MLVLSFVCYCIFLFLLFFVVWNAKNKFHCMKKCVCLAAHDSNDLESWRIKNMTEKHKKKTLFLVTNVFSSMLFFETLSSLTKRHQHTASWTHYPSCSLTAVQKSYFCKVQLELQIRRWSDSRCMCEGQGTQTDAVFSHICVCVCSSISLTCLAWRWRAW